MSIILWGRTICVIMVSSHKEFRRRFWWGNISVRALSCIFLHNHAETIEKIWRLISNFKKNYTPFKYHYFKGNIQFDWIFSHTWCLSSICMTFMIKDCIATLNEGQWLLLLWRKSCRKSLVPEKAVNLTWMVNLLASFCGQVGLWVI